MALHASRFGLADQKRNVWRAVLPAEVEYADIQDPSYWAHTSMKLRAGDIIEVTTEDARFYAEMLVRDAGHLFATVEEIRFVSFEVPEDASADNSAGLSVEYGGRYHKYRVVRMRNGKKEVIASGFETKEAASSERDSLASRMPKAA